MHRTHNLHGITPEAFARHEQLGQIDAEQEGYSEEEQDRQRDLSIKFHWGHHHDFGDFRLEGKMGNRHISMLVNFMTLFPISLNDFERKAGLRYWLLDRRDGAYACRTWSHVFAIEEVRKYAAMAAFLAKSGACHHRGQIHL